MGASIQSVTSGSGTSHEPWSAVVVVVARPMALNFTRAGRVVRKGRGYEYAKNAYIPVDDDELDASTPSFRGTRSTSAISTALTTSPPMAKSARKLLQ